MFLTIPRKTIVSFIELESIYLSMNLSTGQHPGWRVCHHDTFGEVLGVLSERMVKRQELSMLVERRILATLLQPDKSHSCLANRA
jgi:hypothetical protein